MNLDYFFSNRLKSQFVCVTMGTEIMKNERILLMYKKIMKFSLVLALALVLSACGEQDEQGEEANLETQVNEEMGTPVAIVNGERIYEGPYELMIKRALANYEQQGIVLEGDEGEAMLLQIQQQTLDQMIQQVVLLQEAEKSGLLPSDQVVEEELKAIRDQFATEEEYKAALEQNMFSETELKTSIFQELSMKAYMEENLSEVTISDEEIDTFYSQYKAQQEEQMQAMKDSGEEIPEDQLQMMEVPNLEEIKEELVAHLTEQKEQEYLEKLVEELVEKSDIERKI